MTSRPGAGDTAGTVRPRSREAPSTLVGAQRSEGGGYVWQHADLGPAELLHRLTILVRAMPDMMFRLSADGTFLEAKRGAEAEFQRPAEEFLGRSLPEVLPPDLAQRTAAAMQSARAGGVPTFEYQLQGPAGMHWYEARLVAVDDEFVVTVRDITASHEAEHDLATFFELSPDLAVIADMEGRFVRLNAPRWEALLGWPGNDLLTQPYLAFVHPDDVEPTQRAAAKLAAGRSVVGFENRYRTRAGGYRWLEWRCQPTDRGIIVCIARDVTEMKAARDRELVMAEISAALAMSATTPGALAESITRIVQTALPSRCSVALIPENGPGVPEGPLRSARRVAMPVTNDETTTAVLTVSREPDEAPFDLSELELLADIAKQISPLIERAKLYQSLIEAAELLSATDTGIAKVALDGTIISWNPAAERISGWSADSLVGRSMFDVASQPFLERAQHELDEVLRTGGTRRFESERHRPDGAAFWTEISMAPIHDWTGTTVAVAVAFTDITERRRAKVQLELMASTDSLTGIANRAEMERVLSSRLTLGRAGALLFIDLDGFKEVNDLHGHGAGDQVLREAGARLRAVARSSDVVGRFGGDEFGVLMDYGSDPSPDTDLRIAGRILGMLSEPFRVSGHLIELAASCGIAHFPTDATDLDTLLMRADTAMYAAKERGGGHAQRFRTGLDQRLRDLSAEQAMIRRGMQNREFEVEYQPIFSLRERRPLAVEALARWRREGRVLTPAAFLTVAEDSGLIIPLGYQLIELACEQLGAVAATSSAVLGGGLWLNLSRRQFAAEDLPSRLAHILSARDLRPELVTLEITETTLFDDPQQARGTIAALRELGVRIALDDFGTGYSSLGALHDLPVDAVKIDKVFVQRLTSQAGPQLGRDRALVEAAIRMGHALGLIVVAEGVEHPSQQEILTELGCDLAQGLLLAPPSPPDAVLTTFRGGPS